MSSNANSPRTPVEPAHAQIAQEMRSALKRHVMDAWFPRCIDQENGGFFSEFDQKWRRTANTSKMLEFQARQTRVAARLAIAFPEDGRWAEHALHGFRFLRDRMWDREYGGWYWQTTADGSPLAGSTKHSHSGAYTVQAAALVFQATGDKAALEHAEEGLAWFDRYAHDDEFGGFHGWLTREGELIRTASDLPPGALQEEPLGHDIGLKDVNVHGDWFEALLDLATNSGSSRSQELLVESADIYLNKAITPAGEVHYGFHSNWIPQPGPEWYGYGFEAVHRFLSAAAVLPQFPELRDRARKVMLHALTTARRRDGGFSYAGPAGLPPQLEGRQLRAPARVWWVQFEGLRTLALYAAQEESPGPYTRGLQAHWSFIKREMLDERCGGIFSRPEADFRPWVRRWVPKNDWAFRKGHDWKDASHETGCLLESIAILSGQEGWGPLSPSS